MDELKIFWTTIAIKQRDHIFEYWNNRTNDKEYSKKLNYLIISRLQLLKSFPLLGKKTNFGNHRMISLKHYSIFYLLDETKIYITSFWDNRQDRKKLLAILKSE